jgi:hypothetical protein
MKYQQLFLALAVATLIAFVATATGKGPLQIIEPTIVVSGRGLSFLIFSVQSLMTQFSLGNCQARVKP